MRKDLKIGMAIGAVLLVVVIVYVAMPKNDPGQQQYAVGDNGTGDGGDGEQISPGDGEGDAQLPEAGARDDAATPTDSRDTGRAPAEPAPPIARADAAEPNDP